jgi:VanZ family protein
MRIFGAWLLVLSFLSLYPFGRIIQNPSGWEDKAVHVLLYAFTSALLAGVLLTRKSSGVRQWALVAAVAFSSLYGFGMEVAQGMSRHRHFDMRDAYANTAGAVAAALVIWAYRSLAGRAETPSATSEKDQKGG